MTRYADICWVAFPRVNEAMAILMWTPAAAQCRHVKHGIRGVASYETGYNDVAVGRPVGCEAVVPGDSLPQN